MFKQFVIFFVLLSVMICDVYAQSWGYNNHRVAVSFDGNSAPDNAYKWPIGDPDDWGAAAASFAIMAKLNLQKKLVHCSYNNFIDAPPGPDEENQLKISCEGAAKRWGFNNDIIFDVTLQKEEAVDNLASEISKSTKDDPLYFLHAGLSEFLYQAIEKVVNKGDLDCLNHFYLLSHSSFNENEKRRKYHHTWSDIKSLADNRIKYKKIKDQNNKTNPNDLWHSGEDFSVWSWMKNHSDKNIRWMYSRMLAHSGGDADISDCGLFYYLLVGDDNGNPKKFEAFIGKGIILE